MNFIMGFLELGVMILAWTLIWNFLIKGFTGIYAESPAAQGLAAVYNG